MVVRNYSEQDIVGNRFNGQNLNGSTFFKASLTNVSFVDTLLRGTNFEETKWLNVDAHRADFRPSAAFPTTSFV
ncbi:MAG: pentapeptide repeat-containing protein [Limnoraphis robusta]|jgi:uncharacterized protein YjbI with pentapeptide repeats|uniref:Pentapeptide repeat-containing protein n=1 Tax=Limnoraphis robusta CCNP1315 TaxID=3110306 RepID=A0ABU5TU87_9CYAN|nr:pentapeptide repeat-containing protein [Limnoraphis robusta]MEA5518196.1 pentapeptide repeat-containing protein [Limnoraphis robusta CCNP1315]MEA5543360.1 pentapeptide repeat-containing protein [Limnoraphis robusta CCNP1324]